MGSIINRGIEMNKDKAGVKKLWTRKIHAGVLHSMDAEKGRGHYGPKSPVRPRKKVGDGFIYSSSE